MAILTGTKALTACIETGVPLKPFFDKSPDSKPESYSLDLPLQEGGRYKAFLRGKFLALDIDRHEGKPDGVSEFYKLCERLGKTRRTLPNCLCRIDEPVSDDTEHPAYTTTPTDGLHLFFAWDGTPCKKELCPSVEIKTQSITAPGSYKDGLPYRLHGDLRNAPPLPAFLRSAVLPERKVYTPRKRQAFTGAADWARIVEWTQQDARGAEGRNATAYSLAFKARHHGWGEAETLTALLSEPLLGSLPDTERRTACASAFKGAAV
jgi:hypothetical protein